MRIIVVLLIVSLAGCAGKGDGSAPDATDEPLEPDAWQLSGWVVDETVTPIAGATVSVPAHGVNATTGDDGGYGLDGLPVSSNIVVVVEADGYRPTSKSITLDPDNPLRLNFTISALPVLTPYNKTLTFKGIIACEGVIRGSGDPMTYDCGNGMPANEQVWEFFVDENLKGIVVEVYWEPASTAANELNVTVETVDFGELDKVLANNEGASVLRMQVTRYDSERFYSDGGKVRVTTHVGRNVDDDETGAGAGFALQQDYYVYATAFYVESPPPAFSFAHA